MKLLAVVEEIDVADDVRVVGAILDEGSLSKLVVEQEDHTVSKVAFPSPFVPVPGGDSWRKVSWTGSQALTGDNWDVPWADEAFATPDFEFDSGESATLLNILRPGLFHVQITTVASADAGAIVECNLNSSPPEPWLVQPIWDHISTLPYAVVVSTLINVTEEMVPKGLGVYAYAYTGPAAGDIALVTLEVVRLSPV